MPKKKTKHRKVETVNAAPGYAPASAYAAPPAAAAPSGYAAPVNGQSSVPGAFGYGAPPPQAPRNPFINAAFLYQFGKPITATINGMRPAQGGNSKFGADKPGWFLDLTLENGSLATGRINQGDQRHQRLWAAFGPNFQGRKITLRLPHPGDATKAAWTLDAQ